MKAKIKYWENRNGALVLTDGGKDYYSNSTFCPPPVTGYLYPVYVYNGYVYPIISYVLLGSEGQKCDICGSTARDHTEFQCQINRQFKPKRKVVK